jgi:hypothetical protein
MFAQNEFESDINKVMRHIKTIMRDMAQQGEIVSPMAPGRRSRRMLELLGGFCAVAILLAIIGYFSEYRSPTFGPRPSSSAVSVTSEPSKPTAGTSAVATAAAPAASEPWDVSVAEVRAIKSVERMDIFDASGRTVHKGGYLIITLGARRDATPSLVGSGIAQDIFDAAKYQALHGRPFFLMAFISAHNVEDGYGHVSVAPGFSVQFQQADLAKVDWRTMSQQMLLNLASTIRFFSRAGHQAVDAYCKDWAGDARQFCTRAAGE